MIEAAWLHDVLEDTEFRREDLAARGISAEAIAMVEAVTKRAGEPKEEYLARVLACPGAVEVKRADLADDTDPERLQRLEPEARARLSAKDATAFALLDLDPVHPVGEHRSRLWRDRSARARQVNSMRRHGTSPFVTRFRGAGSGA